MSNLEVIGFGVGHFYRTVPSKTPPFTFHLSPRAAQRFPPAIHRVFHRTVNFKIFRSVGHISGRFNLSPGRGKLRDSLRQYTPHCQGENDKRNQQPCSFLKIMAGRGSSMNSELSTGRGKMFPFGNRVGLSKFFQDFFGDAW